jgi:VanZ family protein
VRRRWGLWGPPLVLAAVIYVLSSVSQVPGGEHVWDKAAHVAVFGTLAWLTLRATHGGVRPLTLAPAMGAAALAVGWGVLDEVHQSFVPGRYPSVGDVMADACGTALALLLWALLRGRAGSAANIRAAHPRVRGEEGERG